MKDEFFDRWSALHGGVAVTGLVKGWLTISYFLCRPLAAAKISPNFLTLCGVLASACICITHHSFWGIVFLVFSLICDGIDGTLAIITSKDSARGAMLDSVADRIGEFFWLVAFYLLGAPIWIIGVAWVAAFSQEYVRARIAGLGDFRIDIVTISERPVRASFLAFAMVLHLLKINLVTQTAWMWLVFQIISLVMVSRSGFHRLREADSVGN